MSSMITRYQKKFRGKSVIKRLPVLHYTVKYGDTFHDTLTSTNLNAELSVKIPGRCHNHEKMPSRGTNRRRNEVQTMANQTQEFNLPTHGQERTATKEQPWKHIYRVSEDTQEMANTKRTTFPRHQKNR